MNKQEKNIVDILTFDEIEDIADIFIAKLYQTDKTVALITNKALVEYVMGELLPNEDINVKRVDLELDDEDAEYMISVDDDGNMIVQPVEYYDDKYFNGIEYAFVDMDGCVDQMTIDNLLDRDIPIVLFGCEEQDDELTSGNYSINGAPVTKEEFDEYTSQFKKTEDNEECECDECEYACQKDDKPVTTSKSEYFINGKSVDKSEFDKKYEEFEEMYLDNIRDMMLNYCEFMNSVNEWRSRLLRW